jgi:uncharacterized protein (TIGR02145 family)
MRSINSIFFLFSIIFFTACNDNSQVVPVERVVIEGKDYSLVKIGSQTWTASNHAGPGGVDYDEANSKPEYGKYYSKTELDAITLPAGWRIPTMEDYKALGQIYDIVIPSPISSSDKVKTLISTTNWNNVQGTNASGFNAYPTGYIFSNSDPIDGDIAEFWTSDGNTISIQEAGTNLSSLRIAFYESSSSPDYRFTVRFVKD